MRSFLAHCGTGDSKMDNELTGSTATRQLTEMTDGAPKIISPGVHAVLDYAVAGTFLAMGAYYQRRHRKAATLAFLNGAMVLGLSLITDYPGGVWRAISFKGHGVADAMQAVLAGAGPLAMGFADDPEANFFYSQAASEAGVIAMTDWNARA
jgi:hypothetical protein